MFINQDYSEKRDLIRMDLSCDISVKTIEGQFTANCHDLSGNGIRFTSDEKMDIGDVVDIDIYPVSEITSPLFAKAQVVWVNPQQDSGFHVGAHLKIKN